MRDDKASDGKSVFDQSLDLLEYLSAVAREIGPKPVRDVKEHPFTLWASELPHHASVSEGPSVSRQAWLEVRRVERPKPVAAPQHVRALLTSQDLSSPNKQPALNFTAVNRIAAERSLVDGEVDLEHHDAVKVELREQFDSWRREVWTPWAAVARPIVAALRVRVG